REARPGRHADERARGAPAVPRLRRRCRPPHPRRGRARHGDRVRSRRLAAAHARAPQPARRDLPPDRPMTSALPADRLERVTAWGGATSVESIVQRARDVDDVHEAFRLARARGLTVGLRGAGQSYGDASLNAENVCLDLSEMRRVLAWDPTTGIVRAEP